MSYWRGGAGGGGQRRGGRGGPNRGGGRHISGGGGGHPSGLKGRDIGLYYAKRSRANKKVTERNSRAVINIDRESERNISRILSDVRQQSGSDQQPSVPDHLEWGPDEHHSLPDRSRSPWRASHTQSVTGWPMASAGPSSGGVAGGSSGSIDNDCQWSTLEETGAGVTECRNFDGTDYGGTTSTESEGFRFSSSRGFKGSHKSRLDFETQSTSVEASGADSLSDQLPGLGRSGSTQAGTLSGSVTIDRKLMDDLFEARKTNRKYREMLEFRERLPSWKARNDLLELVKSSQVSVVSGETGCGKTTQVPQFIVDDAILNGWGSRCHVICTQPRRISAISVAQRVAAERGEPLGESSGYQIRLEHKLPRALGSVLYCTTGVLLRRLIGDPTLSEASHVIMDEVHERNISSDFLTIIMKDLLIKRPDLKLILMSATINAKMFSDYFNNAPTYTIQNVAFPVTEYFLEDILAKTSYSPPPAKPSRPWRGRNRGNYEEEQRKLEEKEQYLQFLETNRHYPNRVIEALRTFDDKAIDVDLVMELIKYICRSMREGAILIFLPGWDTISKLHDLLKASPVFRSNNYLIIPLHSMMPTSFQQTVFDRPPPGVRKIVIATNIAETSITIDDVVYVIDCGKVKETTYDPTNQMACLDAVWVSRAAARQRRGRAGRVQEGYCFHMFTKLRHENMEEFQKAEILRTPLEELILQIKILKLGQVMLFLEKAIESPDKEAVEVALKCLRDLNALTADEELTPLGRHLANLPVNPRIGKIILFGAMFSCLDPVLTIASSLGFKEPFIIPLHKQEEADAVKKRFAGRSRSDHIALLNAFKGWQGAREHGDARSFCWNHFLANNTLELLRNMKVQFSGLLHDIGFISSANPGDRAANYNSNNIKLVKAVLCAGLYPNVIKIELKKQGGFPKLYTKKDGKVSCHPKSVNSDEREFDSSYMVYHTKVKSSSVFIHDSSTIPPLPLLFFGGNISVKRDEDQEVISVDDWIVFQAAQRTGGLVQEMRQELDSVLEQKVANPRMELYDPSQQSRSPVSKLIQAIIDLITTEDYSQQASRLASGKHLYVRRK